MLIWTARLTKKNGRSGGHRCRGSSLAAADLLLGSAAAESERRRCIRS